MIITTILTITKYYRIYKNKQHFNLDTLQLYTNRLSFFLQQMISFGYFIAAVGTIVVVGTITEGDVTTILAEDGLTTTTGATETTEGLFQRAIEATHQK